MRLLVSVRAAGEARAALAGGAEIVDAKEPGRGSLGAVDPAVLAEIAAALPADVPLSAALGDAHTAEAARAAVLRAPVLRGRQAPFYLKLGFAGVRDCSLVRRLVGEAVDAARTRTDGAAVIAVAYADAERAGGMPPDRIAAAAAEEGAAGVLIDTWDKGGGNLFRWLGLPELATWVDGARARGLLTALAGGLAGEAVDLAAATGTDVIGVRGAVCEGGRAGVLRTDLVREVRSRVPGAVLRS